MPIPRLWQLLLLALAGLILVLPKPVHALPTGKIAQLKAQRKKASKVATTIKLSLELGHLYRDHKAHEQAIAEYKALSKKYPKPEVRCVTLHFWAQTLLDQKKQSAALALYGQLRKQFKGCDCRYLPNAYIALGRASFDQKNYQQALSWYRKAPRCGKNRIAAIAAEYMKGWCTYKLKRYPQALKALLRTLRQIRKERRRFKGAQRKEIARIQKEAWPNLVRAYNRAGKANAALRTFRQVAPRAQADKMVEQLASSFHTTKSYRKLLGLYKQLARSDRRPARQLHYGLEILRTHERLKDAKGLLRALNKLTRLTRKHQRRAKRDDAVKKKRDAIRKQLARFAKGRHREAQKSRSKALYRQAERFFAAHLRLFPKAPDAHTMAYWHGEVLLEDKRFAQAATAYRSSARHTRTHKHQEDAAYKAALARHRLLEKQRRLQYKSPSPKKNARPQRLPKRYKAFLDEGRFYLAKYPRAKNVPYVAYNVGLALQTYGHWDAARKAFVQVIQTHPTTKYALPAAYHVVDTLRIRKQWALLHTWTKTFAAIDSLGKARFKQRMRSMSQAAKFQSCALLNKRKEYAKAGQCYHETAQLLGKHKDTPVCLYNAFVAYHNGKQTQKANAVKQELLRRFPRSRPARLFKRRKR